ncbi:nicotinamide riboside transporter PnuC [Pseudomonas sp. NPDC007930]|uniref:nicotinamide riboside transporter PnuC n=1 Tax=Pseudomonas sp. NPDC007930 TaxID=3364417 RepID=UPI0036F02215
MSNLEWLAVAISALSVWLTVIRTPWCWPIGLVGVALYAWLFFTVKLYSDALLQVVFAVLQLYGWWQWTRGGAAHEGRPLSRLGGRGIALGLACGAAGALALGALMAHFTDAEQPWLDAALTAFSLVAQAWMARKYLQCWPLWLAIDVVYVGLYLFKGLNLTAALYVVFVALAALGWRQWRAAPAPAA